MSRIAGTKQKAFTIVELLIVIVVIGILAAITIVAYNGIQNRARASAASSALSQAAKKIAVWQVDNPSTTPSSLATAGITDTSDVTFQYTPGTNGAYCITATATNISYKITESSNPTPGGCSGHGQGGVAAVTNLLVDPRATGTRWFSVIAGTVTRTLNVSWSGETNWARHVSTSAGYSVSRVYLNEPDLTNGATYTISFLVGNDGTSTVTLNMDFCDMNTTGFTVAPGEKKRVSFSGSRSSYAAPYHFVDLNISTTTATGLLIKDGMVTLGTTQYNYADGSTTNWIWNGTPNNSTSTGPPV